MFHRIIVSALALVMFAGSAVAQCGGGCSMEDKADVKAHQYGVVAAPAAGTQSLKTPAMEHENGAMMAVFNAKALYTCPMHPAVVTADKDLPCPICNMKLQPMSDEQVKKLRDSHPKGCPMHPIVVPGDSKSTECPICGMKLVEIKAEKAAQ